MSAERAHRTCGVGRRGRSGAEQTRGVYLALYMLRTQIYLTDEQRARLGERARAKGVPLAVLIREAVDLMLGAEDDLDATFGSVPDIAGRVPPRGEWERRGPAPR